MGENLWRIEITYFLSSCLWNPNYTTYSTAEKYAIVIFSSHFSKLIYQLTEAALQVFLGKVFWKYAANLSEYTHAEVRFQ